jgi:hypothetical protein
VHSIIALYGYVVLYEDTASFASIPTYYFTSRLLGTKAGPGALAALALVLSIIDTLTWASVNYLVSFYVSASLALLMIKELILLSQGMVPLVSFAAPLLALPRARYPALVIVGLYLALGLALPLAVNATQPYRVEVSVPRANVSGLGFAEVRLVDVDDEALPGALCIDSPLLNGTLGTNDGELLLLLPITNYRVTCVVSLARFSVDAQFTPVVNCTRACVTTVRLPYHSINGGGSLSLYQYRIWGSGSVARVGASLLINLTCGSFLKLTVVSAGLWLAQPRGNCTVNVDSAEEAVDLSSLEASLMGHGEVYGKLRSNLRNYPYLFPLNSTYYVEFMELLSAGNYTNPTVTVYTVNMGAVCVNCSGYVELNASIRGVPLIDYTLLDYMRPRFNVTALEDKALLPFMVDLYVNIARTEALVIGMMGLLFTVPRFGRRDVIKPVGTRFSLGYEETARIGAGVATTVLPRIVRLGPTWGGHWGPMLTGTRWILENLPRVSAMPYTAAALYGMALGRSILSSSTVARGIVARTIEATLRPVLVFSPGNLPSALFRHALLPSVAEQLGSRLRDLVNLYSTLREAMGSYALVLALRAVGLGFHGELLEPALRIMGSMERGLPEALVALDEEVVRISALDPRSGIILMIGASVRIVERFREELRRVEVVSLGEDRVTLRIGSSSFRISWELYNLMRILSLG